MPPNTSPQTGPPSDEELRAFVEEQTGFGLEMQVVQALHKRDIRAEHGGRCIDPHESKPRQFDIRAHYRERSINQFRFGFAIECKGFSAEYPMIVFEVERPPGEDFVYAITCSEASPATFIKRIDGTTLYKSEADNWAGRATDNFRRPKGGERKIESDVFNKWSQAINSAHAMARDYSANPARTNFYFPILVVPDGRLFVARYRADDRRLGIEGTEATSRNSVCTPRGRAKGTGRTRTLGSPSSLAV